MKDPFYTEFIAHIKQNTQAIMYNNINISNLHFITEKESMVGKCLSY